MSRPLKRSFTLDGHRTSVSLEAPFWEALRDVAAELGLSVSALVQRVDHQRVRDERGDMAGDSSLSGAIRVYLLRHYRLQTGLPAASIARAASEA